MLILDVPDPAAILFDLDGTLINSERWHQQAELETYAEFGFRPTPEEMLEGVGIPMSITVLKLSARYGIEVSPDRFRERHQPRLTHYIQTHMTLFDDVPNCLRECRKFPIGLVTSSERWYVEKVMERFQPHLDGFQVIVCAEDAPCSKPDPAPYIHAAALLGLSPHECLAVEDSPNGIASAIAAGCQTVVVDRAGRYGRFDSVRSISSLMHLMSEG